MEDKKQAIFAIMCEIQQCTDEILELALDGYEGKERKYIELNEMKLDSTKDYLYQINDLMQMTKETLIKSIN